MNPTQQKINDVTYLVREFNTEVNKMIACVSRLSKHYEELDWEEREKVHSILVQQQKDAEEKDMILSILQQQQK